jgi:NADPH:quinone reductase-like Zn-dependent oxidoreductase
LQGLRDKGKIQEKTSGQSGKKQVLVNGASGGVGTYAVQIAKTFNVEVTGVCSTSKMDLVRSIGADHVVDYKKEDVTRSGKQYDLIFDIAAFRPVSDYKRILSPGGMYVMAGGSIKRIFQLMFLSMTGAKNMEVIIADVNRKDLLFIKELLETGKMKSIIDKSFPLNETARAVRYLEEGHARGKVVITVEPDAA